jgi:6-phosphogluconolactonase
MQTTAVVLVEQTPADAAEVAAQRVVDVLNHRISQAGHCNIALSGGTTPIELYRRLATSQLSERVDWNKVQVFLGDERDVPADSVESNYRMMSEMLLGNVPVPLENVHPMQADSVDLPGAAEQYEKLIRRLAPAENGVPRFDLIMLGLGADCHTASLFPGTPALTERQRLVVSQFVPVIGRHRMTITFPLINAARMVLFFVTGADKADAVAGVLTGEGPREQCPASMVAPTSGELVFVLDAQAARKLHKS